jgi:hypothetical protein
LTHELLWSDVKIKAGAIKHNVGAIDGDLERATAIGEIAVLVSNRTYEEVSSLQEVHIEVQGLVVVIFDL